MASLFDDGARGALLTRIGSLTPSATRQWGQMTPGGMLLHLGHSVRMALGELPVKPANKRAFQVFPLKHLLLYVVPFPKGARTAPELRVTDSGDFEGDKKRLLELLGLLAGGLKDGMGPVHPLFGPLSRKEWGVLTHKHADHHLRQFGA